MNRTKFNYIFGGIITFFVLGIGSYIYLNTKGENFPVKEYIIRLAISLIIIAAIGIGLYFLFNRDNDDDEIELPKIFVNKKKAIELWKCAFAKENGIAYFLDPEFDEEDNFRLANEDAIDIRNRMSHSDPSDQTADRFITFEAIISEGKRKGMLVCTIARDLGEDYILNNGTENIEWNKGLATYNRDMKKYPLTNSKHHIERLQMKRLDMIEEGYSEQEAERYISPLILSNNSAKQLEPIKTPKISDQFPEYANKSDDDDTEDIESDIEKYRKDNR